MILSHRHRFIFIKTRKTAGTSIEVFLSGHCGPEDALTPIRPAVEGHVARNDRGLFNPMGELLHGSRAGRVATLRDLRRRRRFYNHIPAETVRHRVGRRLWDDYFTFCVERNPWDKTLSHYHMRSTRGDGALTLDEYLARGDYCINLPMYTDRRDGRVLVDRIVRYEALTEDLGEVFAHLGIPFSGNLGVRAKSHYRDDDRPYREVYSPAQRRVVERAFEDEIRMHGYAF